MSDGYVPREAILAILEKDGPASHRQVAEKLDNDPFKTWRHLHLLKRARYVDSTGRGEDTIWRRTDREFRPLVFLKGSAGRRSKLGAAIPADDDLDVLDGMRMWDDLRVKEQAALFRRLWGMVVAYSRNRDIGHMYQLMNELAWAVWLRVDGTFEHDSREPITPPAPGELESVDMDALIASLRGEDTSDTE